MPAPCSSPPLFLTKLHYQVHHIGAVGQKLPALDEPKKAVLSCAWNFSEKKVDAKSRWQLDAPLKLQRCKVGSSEI